MIQTQVLNYLLTTADISFVTSNNLTDIYFSDYKAEFDFIINHYDVYHKIPDKATFLQSFPDFELVDVEEPAKYLLDELCKDYKTRELVKTFNKIKNNVVDGKIEDAMALYEQSVDRLSSVGVAIESVDITKDVSRYQDYVDRLTDFSKYYITTGFKELDSIIGGFDREEELACIVARSNVGKSWALLKMAIASAQQGLKVGFYSGEMSERKVGYRFDTLFGHMNNGGITHGNEKYQSEYKNYIDNLPTSISGSINVVTPEKLGGFATVGSLRAFVEKENLDILFIDQISLMEDQRHGRTTPEQQSNIIKDLKKLQVLLKKPIIFVCQQNRADDENGSDTKLIAGSDDIGRFATMVLFLFKKDDTFTIDLTKSRDSENFKKLNYIIDLNLGNFTYIPTDDEISNVNEDSKDDLEVRYDVEMSKGDDVF